MARTKHALLGLLAAVVALGMMTAPALAAPAMTDTSGYGRILFTGSGADTANYTIYVGHPAALGLDSDYWNITVYSDAIAGATVTNATIYVHIHINDGATNVTSNTTLSAKNDVRAYANASIASATILTLTQNASALYYVEIITSTGVVLGDYVGIVNITDYEYIATAISLLYVMIPVVVIVSLFEYIKVGMKK